MRAQNRDAMRAGVRPGSNLPVPGGAPAAAPLRGEKDLLTVLRQMKNQPLAAGIDRSALVGQTIIELDDASTVNQRTRNTCGATACQVILANRQPAEYARLVSDLASPAGRATLANGDAISRPANWNAADGGRSVPSRLLQPAFMEYANGLSSYDNASDLNLRLNATTYQGLYPEDESRLFQGFLGAGAGNVNSTQNGGTTEPAALLSRIEEAVKRGDAAVALIDYPGRGGHYVTVTGIHDGRVVYQNPWGTVESMSTEAFKGCLLSGVFPKQVGPKASVALPPPLAATPRPVPPAASAPEQSTWKRFWSWLAE